ncbi:hypothetical protein [Sphingobacterium wenxiniae]|uniref:Uncharacterized protein n=1 Tax=Sphingobacterium wenxiniae TaxID=683125 RepID=A0A1I6TFU9_9SPHI|nr:hypothetical protein [Sphingobacterium wenxiniae]SFS88036.1 hypothetical protein SAMN05660206_106123 [Sphingobacterium wenxiniae]
MPHNHQIKHVVQFPEQTAVLQEQSENALFDILIEDSKLKFKDKALPDDFYRFGLR